MMLDNYQQISSRIAMPTYFLVSEFTVYSICRNVTWYCDSIVLLIISALTMDIEEKVVMF